MVLVAGCDEVAEDRVGLQRFGFEFGVELAAEEEGVGGDFYDFDVGGVGGGAGDAQASAGEDGLILAVELVTVAMTFGDFGLAVGVSGERAGFEDAVPGAETHRPTHLFNASQLA